MAAKKLGGRYTVQDKIGTGGMAIVYRGLDEVLGRTVAIKMMLPQYANDESFAARFKQEAQAAAALQSPYIVSVYDWGRDGDAYYIVMEYLRGTDLKSGIRKHGALDCRKVAQIGSQISQALTVAHRHDIIHRDIKPQNLMVQPDGNIKVMDFGIARAKNSHLTADNSVLGTAHYVSPEQTQGRDLGPTTDIYSLGIVMYEAATGRVPFDGDDAISVALKQVNEAPMPPSQINPRVDPALESIILKCMQKRPEDRFQSADELYHVLRDYLSGRLQAVRDKTAIIAPFPTDHMRRPNDVNQGRGRGVQQTGKYRNPSETTGHYHTKTATEQNRDRKHRRNVIVGVIVTILIIAAVGAAAAFVLGRQQTRQVPNLIGLAQEEAIAQIEQSGYFKKGTVKEEYSDKVAKGKVIDQDPDANKSAPEGSSINLVVSKGEQPAQSVTVPNLTGKTPTEADTELRRVGLIGQTGDSVFSNDVEVGKIASQSPAGGKTAKAGDTIVYNLSKGAESAEVPNVIGWSQEEATAAVQNAGFTVIVNSEESDSYDAGTICGQSVTGSAPMGSEVVLTVSTGSAKVQVPVVVGSSESAATAALTNAGFSVATISQASSDVAAGYVIAQSLSGSAERGSTVTLSISTGPAQTTPTSDSSSQGDSGSGSSTSGGSSSSTSGGGTSGGSSSSTSGGDAANTTQQSHS